MSCRKMSTTSSSELSQKKNEKNVSFQSRHSSCSLVSTRFFLPFLFIQFVSNNSLFSYSSQWKLCDVRLFFARHFSFIFSFALKNFPFKIDEYVVCAVLSTSLSVGRFEYVISSLSSSLGWCLRPTLKPLRWIWSIKKNSWRCKYCNEYSWFHFGASSVVQRPSIRFYLSWTRK